MNDIKVDFLLFINTISTQSFIALGKIANPLTGKLEKDLRLAKYNIEVLRMLREKTKGNLSNEEKEALNSIIMNLELNYVDVLNEDVKKKSKEEVNKNNVKSDKKEEKSKLKESSNNIDSEKNEENIENKKEDNSTR